MTPGSARRRRVGRFGEAVEPVPTIPPGSPQGAPGSLDPQRPSHGRCRAGQASGGACIDTRCASLRQQQLPRLGHRLRFPGAPLQSGARDAARSGASATDAPTEAAPGECTRCAPPGPVSQRRVAWVVSSDEATREGADGACGESLGCVVRSPHGGRAARLTSPSTAAPTYHTHVHSRSHDHTGNHSRGSGRRRLRGVVCPRPCARPGVRSPLTGGGGGPPAAVPARGRARLRRERQLPG